MLITIKEFAAELKVNPQVIIEMFKASGVEKCENDTLTSEDKKFLITKISVETELKKKKLGLKKKTSITTENENESKVIRNDSIRDSDTPKIEIKRKKNLVQLEDSLDSTKTMQKSNVDTPLEQEVINLDTQFVINNNIIEHIQQITNENTTSVEINNSPIEDLSESNLTKSKEDSENITHDNTKEINKVLSFEELENKKGKVTFNKNTKKPNKMKIIGIDDSTFDDIVELDSEVKTVLEQIPENIKSKFTNVKRHDKPKSLKIPRIQEFQKPTQKQQLEIVISEFVTVSDLAHKIAVKSSEVIKSLMKMGMMVTINQALDKDIATIVIEEFGHKVRFSNDIDVEHSLIENNSVLDYKPRAAIVTIMGHVDHGKTSLLDRIRKTKVAHGEAGGITQHIGAYLVDTGHGKITFLDTPGHEAFTQLRARGSKLTDIVVLVVAADDGVMPQTIEAINHAKAADVPIIIAINKMDKPGANPDKVKQELGQYGIVSEEWGGSSIFVNISALSGLGIDKLLDSIILQAELLELVAPENSPAKGIIIESKLDRGRGAVVSVLVQQGTLKKSDYVLAGTTYGKVKALYNELGRQVESAGPSTPVEVLGFSDIPNSGDELVVFSDEKKAREIAAFRLSKKIVERQSKQQASKLENLFSGIKDGVIKQLPIIVKSDAQGSYEAITSSLEKISNDEVKVIIIHAAIGGINESDVNLAISSKAIIIGFNSRADVNAKKLAELNNIEIRYYNIIYEIIDDVKSALIGMLSPEQKESIIGNAEVRNIFTVGKNIIAGCMVTDGVIKRNAKVRIIRDKLVIFDGNFGTLKRFKDDVKEVKNGYECGLTVDKYNELKEGDILEIYEVIEVRRTL